MVIIFKMVIMVEMVKMVEMVIKVVMAAISRFPCCVLSYFSVVFVMEHSMRW